MAGLLGLSVAELGGYCGEEEGRMDEDMEEGGFEEFRVDFEYEYDAPRFFDFCRWESDGEAMVSERWFDSVPSNPPSRKMTNTFAFIALLNDAFVGIVNID